MRWLLDVQSSESVQQRDLELITSNINANINNKDLEDALVRYFDRNDELSNEIEYKAACFVGFDRKVYEEKGQLKKTEEIYESIRKQIQEWHQKLEEKIKNHQLCMKEMHIFMIPFPSVEEFRNYFLKEIKKC